MNSIFYAAGDQPDIFSIFFSHFHIFFFPIKHSFFLQLPSASSLTRITQFPFPPGIIRFVYLQNNPIHALKSLKMIKVKSGQIEV